MTTQGGLAREQGVRLPSSHTGNFANAVRRRKSYPPSRQSILEPGLTTLDALTSQVEFVETELGKLCSGERAIQILATVPGVALIIAASFVSVIDDARFRRAHEVQSYLGLVPSEATTGGRRRLGAISKQGNCYLRALMVQAAWVLWRTADKRDPLRQWVDAVSKRRGKRVAVIALARRLFGVMWAMWRDGTVYESERLATHQARGVRQHAQTPEYRATALEAAARKLPYSISSSTPEVTTT
ncbi:MAG TPA: IS110 family transposase [Polyangiaceae bacterium]